MRKTRTETEVRTTKMYVDVVKNRGDTPTEGFK